MVFTAFQARRLNPEEVNPMAGAVSKAMQGIKEGVNTAYLPKNLEAALLHKQIINKYLPQMQEAEIFGKQFGPLASIATTPMFLQNPQFQKALGQMIAQHMHLGSGQEGAGGQGGSNESPTFAGQTNIDVKDATALAKELSKAGKVKGYISSAGGGAVNYLGDVGKKIIGLLPGQKTKEFVDPALAEKTHQFETFLNGLKNRALQSQALNPTQAEEVFSEHQDENAMQRLERIKRTVPSLFQQGEALSEEKPEQPMDVEDERNDDNRDLSFAADLAEKIKKKTGHDISPDLIFNYMKRVPGKISIPLLLKAAGVR